MLQKIKVKVKAKVKAKEKEKEKAKTAKEKAEENPKVQALMKKNNDRSKIVVIGWKRALALAAGNAATIMILASEELVGADHSVPADHNLLAIENQVPNQNLVENRLQEKRTNHPVLIG